MYLFFTIAIPLLLILLLLNYFRRKKIIKKVRSMCLENKCNLLNELLEPFGYSYVPSQDIFMSRHDAWQRKMGYGALYDNAASHFGMVFDSLPIYFNYQGRTWLLEFWKGQYGINTGCEMGVYYADRILEEKELEHTLFQAVEDADMLRMSFALRRKDIINATLTEKHWWLTGFKPGCFSHPSDLSLYASITFPSPKMTTAFVQGLLDSGYSYDDICRHYNTVSFTFADSAPVKDFLHKIRVGLTQCLNRFWCKVYLSITKPFCLSLDRTLYLYYYLPFAFRKTLRIHKYRKHKSGRKH